jgi:carnitine O-acetyltransferase
MSYSSLAVRILNMSKPSGEPILPSKLRLASDDDASKSNVTAPPDAENRSQNATSLGHSSTAKNGITFANQDSLPKLPIPDLESTCRKYLEALYPLQSPREHEETKAAVQDFLRSEGPELQEKLKKYASSKTSYIEQFCR